MPKAWGSSSLMLPRSVCLDSSYLGSTKKKGKSNYKMFNNPNRLELTYILGARRQFICNCRHHGQLIVRRFIASTTTGRLLQNHTWTGARTQRPRANSNGHGDQLLLLQTLYHRLHLQLISDLYQTAQAEAGGRRAGDDHAKGQGTCTATQHRITLGLRYDNVIHTWVLWRQAEVAHQHDQRESQLGHGHIAVVNDQHVYGNILAGHVARLRQI